MPCLPNLASSKDEPYERSMLALRRRARARGGLGIPFVVTHLGHHLGAGSEAGEARVIAALDLVMTSAPPGVTLLVENTAGEKNSVGSSFASIARILEGCACPGRIGVCLDTCHAFAAGHDLRAATAWRRLSPLSTTRSASEALLRALHCNDSKDPHGSGRDRHEHVGLGAIGEEGFRLILQRPEFADLPFICETPRTAGATARATSRRSASRGLIHAPFLKRIHGFSPITEKVIRESTKSHLVYR